MRIVDGGYEDLERIDLNDILQMFIWREVVHLY